MFSVRDFALQELFRLSRVDVVDARKERRRMVRVSNSDNKTNETQNNINSYCFDYHNLFVSSRAFRETSHSSCNRNN
jgi:hypothetical protein